jgi:hypothetical protein
MIKPGMLCLYWRGCWIVVRALEEVAPRRWRVQVTTTLEEFLVKAHELGPIPPEVLP